MSEEKNTADSNEDAAKNVNGNEKNMPKWKKRTIKWGSIAAVVILLLIFLPGIIVSYVVPPIASQVLKTKVEIGFAFINVFDGAVNIRNVKIHNPEGYDAPYAFELGHFEVDVDMFTLAAPKLVIEEVILEGMHATLETKWGTNNFKDIGKALEKSEKNAEPEPEEKTEEEPAADEPEKEPQQMIIRHLLIRDCDFTMFKVPLILPPMEMNDIGDGRPVSEFFIVLYDAVIEAVVTAAKNVSDGIVDFGETIGKSTKDAGENIGKSLQDAGKSLQGLFK